MNDAGVGRGDLGFATAIARPRFDPGAPSPLPFDKADRPIAALERALPRELVDAAVRAAVSRRGDREARSALAAALRSARSTGEASATTRLLVTRARRVALGVFLGRGRA